MSVWAKKWAYEQHPKRLDEDGKITCKKHPSAKAVLVALAEFPGPGQRQCWPSQNTLATMTDFTERQVRACLSDLEKQGLIKRTRQTRRDGTRRSDMITLLGPEEAFGPPQDADDQPEESSGSQPEESSGHEPSVIEPSVSTPSVAKATSGAVYDSSREASAPLRANDYFARFIAALEENGTPIDAEDRKRIPKNMKICLMKYGATHEEMVKVVAMMGSGYQLGYDGLSPQKALRKVRGVADLGGSSVTPEAGIEAIAADPDLAHFATVCEGFDFTSTKEPPPQVLRRLGGTDEERWRYYEMIRSVVRRAVSDDTASAKPKEGRR
jgi:hypothetical protein